MVRQQRASKVHEDRFPSCHSRGTSEHRGKDELVKRDMLDPPRYLRRTEDIRGKALSFGVLDWKQIENWKDTSNAEGTKGACCSYASSYNGSAETASSSLELDLSTGVVKRLELDSKKPQAATVNFSQNMRNDSFSLRSKEYSDAMEADTVTKTDEKGKLDHQPMSRKQKDHQAAPNKDLVEKEQSNAEGECSSERSQNCLEKPHLLDENIPNVTSKKGRHASPNRRFSFSFSQMGRSFSSKESSSSVPSLSSTSRASAKSGPLTFNDSVYANHSTRTKPSNGHSKTRSGPISKPKTEKNVPIQMASKPPTMEKKQHSSGSHALLQYTLRKGINLFQFVVDNNINNVLAATMKSCDSSTRSYTLYSVKEVTKKSDSWLNRHRNEEKNHPFVHTIIGQMKTVTSFTSDLATHKSESVLFGVETSEELAAIVQTRNRTQRQNTTTIILPSGVHTLPKDGNAPLSLINRWKFGGGACDCGGWDIGCKLRVLSNDHTKSQPFSSNFQLFDQVTQFCFKALTFLML